ncbi:MAG: hypothetical protein AAGD38_22300, partial [Acidobacteriota bacterium]
MPESALAFHRRVTDAGWLDEAPFEAWFRVRFDRPAVIGPVGVYVGRMQDIDEVFVNGTSIGGEGVFDRWPVPDKARGYRIPESTLGSVNELLVRVQMWSSGGGLVDKGAFVGP